MAFSRGNSPCAEGLVCSSVYASGRICATACDTASDCASGELCHLPVDCASSELSESCEKFPEFTRGACIQPCTADRPLSSGTCIDGVPTSCEDAGTLADCRDCGCEPGLRCPLAGGACVSLAKVGEPCEGNADCESDNCGTLPGGSAPQCFVPAGDPCDATNCGSCAPTAGGEGPVCAQACSHGACPNTAPGCYGEPGEQRYCRRYCILEDIECPPGWFCKTVADAPEPWGGACFPK